MRKDEIEVVNYSEALGKINQQAVKDIINCVKGILVSQGKLPVESILKDN